MLLAACSRQELEWRRARGTDTVPAYETYLGHFPAGAHAGEARGRIRSLRDERDWARALLADFTSASAPAREPAAPSVAR